MYKYLLTNYIFLIFYYYRYYFNLLFKIYLINNLIMKI